ncbi:MAG: hypothetical protein R2838_19055 [Caldilineaceae bacterium]
MYETDQYEGMIAETVTITGANGDEIYAHLARFRWDRAVPRHGAGSITCPAGRVVPGGDAFAHHGYATISPRPLPPRRPRHARRCGGQGAPRRAR